MTRRVPHVYAIIFSLIVLTAIASLVVPAGSFERDTDGRVVAGSFSYDADAAHEIPPRPSGPGLLFAVFLAPLRGIAAVADIVAFILVVGGAFKVMERSGAFGALIGATATRLAGRETLAFAAIMLLFSAGGAVFGMSEEVIPFVLLLVPLVRALGFEPVVAVAVPVIGSGVGFAGAMINPFTVGIAQAIADLPPVSGWQFRSAVWVLVTTLGIAYVMRTARRARLPADGDHGRPAAATVEQIAFTRVHAGVLAVLAASIVVILVGVGVAQWYVTEIGAVFLAGGIVAGFVARMSGSEIAGGFVEGARDLLSAALVVGIARGIVLLAGDTRILDTVLHGMSIALDGLPPWLSINLMFLFQSLLNFLLPSGSGQAALTMPIMAPLADLIGLTRQQAVLAYQFGDGFSNMIIPTGTMLMGSLEAAKVPYERWFAFAWRLQVWLVAFGAGMLGLAVAIGF